MRRIVTLVILLSLLPLRAFADEPTPVVAIPPGEDRIEALKKGDPAPYGGQLFDPATALRWANYLQQYKLRLKADVELQKKLAQAESDYQKRVLTIEQEKYTRVTGALEEENTRLKIQLADRPFYESVWFGVVVGAVAMGTAVGFAAWGLSSVN